MKDKETISFEDTSTAFASKSNSELRQMHFLFSFMRNTYLTKIGTNFVKTALNLRFPVKKIIKKTLFKQFCGGETIVECNDTIKELQRYNITTIPDYAVEGESLEKNYDKTTDVINKLIELDELSNSISFTVFKITGIASYSILEKIQKGEQLSLSENQEFERIKQRLDKICAKAHQKNVRLLIDAEESWIQGTVDVLAYSMMNKYNKETAIVYNTYQMYRADMEANLKEAYEVSLTDKFFLGVKLVRGAYMEKENLRAQQKGYKSPIFASKVETDTAFDNVLDFCLDNLERIFLCCGSHNEESNLKLAQGMQKRNIPANDERIFFSQLYGMSDHISYNLAKAGFNVAKYLPFGPVETVLPYLFRRAEENKAVAGQTTRELNLIEKEIERRKLN